MEVKVPVRYVWRRFWTNSSHGGIGKVWRKIWRRVPLLGNASTLPNGWDTQSITYKDCETFFEAVGKGSKKKLIKMFYDTHGPDVTTELAKCYNEDEETPLIVAIRQRKLKIVKYLTQKLKVPLSQHSRLVWKGVKYPEAPPLFAAIVCGQTDIVRFLIVAEKHYGQSFNSIKSVVSSHSGRQQKIDILELMGAAYLCFSQLHGTRESGLMCWRKAMGLRHTPINGWQAVPKPQLIFSSEIARKAVGYALEFTTLEQLEQLNASDLQLYTQSILVSERVFRDFGMGTNHFGDFHLCQYVDMCRKEEEHGRVVCAAIVAIEIYQHHLKSFDCKIVSRILSQATKSFKELLRYGPRNSEEGLTFANLMKTFEFATGYTTYLHKAEQDCRSGTLYDLAMIILEITLLIVEMFPQLSANEIHQFKCCLYRFIRLDLRFGYYDQNLLHLICRCKLPHELARSVDLDNQIDDEDDYRSISSHSDDEAEDTDDDDFDTISIHYEDEEEAAPAIRKSPSTELQTSVIRLFLELGTDPNSTDVMDSTPLHLLAKHSEDFAPAQVVIEHGGHVDQVQIKGESPLMFFKQRLAYLCWFDGDTENADPRLQALVNNVLPLSCLAAQVLHNYPVPFDENIPVAMHSFINCH